MLRKRLVPGTFCVELVGKSDPKKVSIFLSTWFIDYIGLDPMAPFSRSWRNFHTAYGNALPQCWRFLTSSCRVRGAMATFHSTLIQYRNQQASCDRSASCHFITFAFANLLLIHSLFETASRICVESSANTFTWIAMYCLCASISMTYRLDPLDRGVVLSPVFTIIVCHVTSVQSRPSTVVTATALHRRLYAYISNTPTRTSVS
jgi:hypothetical protein